MTHIRTYAIALLVATAAFAAAKPPFLKTFIETYKVSPSSKLGKARCLICHQAPAPPELNPYGKQVVAALDAAHARFVTAEMLKSVEKKNVGDGVTNISKIKSDQMPGELKPKAKPKGKPIKKKGKKKPVAVVLASSTGLAFLFVPLLTLACIGCRRR